MREEHQLSSVRRRPRRFVFADLPSWFFLPRYLRLPDICTRRAVDARPSYVRVRKNERMARHTYMPRLLCPGECEVSAHRGVTQPHDSPIRWKCIYHSFSLAFFFLLSLVLSLSLSANRIGCISRESDRIQIYTRTKRERELRHKSSSRSC